MTRAIKLLNLKAIIIKKESFNLLQQINLANKILNELREKENILRQTANETSQYLDTQTQINPFIIQLKTFSQNLNTAIFQINEKITIQQKELSNIKQSYLEAKHKKNIIFEKKIELIIQDTMLFQATLEKIDYEMQIISKKNNQR